MKWRLATRKTIYIISGARKDAARFIEDLNRCRAHPAIVYLSGQEAGERFSMPMRQRPPFCND